MAQTKRFHVSDILSITDGHVVSTRRMEGIYDILNWMTDDNLFTHQLPRAADECAPLLRATFPDLTAVVVPELHSETDLNRFLAELEANGVEMWRDVPRLWEDHARIDPVLELQHMVGADKVIPVVVGDAS